VECVSTVQLRCIVADRDIEIDIDQLHPRYVRETEARL
jgi:hypothetical protein